MGIAPDSNGSTPITAGATSASVDITSAAVGAWCYCWCPISTGSTTQTGVPSNAGWTTLQSVQTAAGTSGACYAIFRRQKQAGDTTFSFTWTTSGKGVFSWASYTGLNNATPDEQSAIALNDTTSRAAVPTPSATPSAPGEWALAFFGQRSTVSTNKPTAWTPDAALTERKEADNSAAASSPWLGADIEDSNGAVTVASHSYTATSNQTESHDGSGILFLIPAPTGPQAAAPLMPPGFLSPAAWQQPPHPRLGQVVTIAGAGGVILPKPSLSGQGAVSPPAAFPAVQPMPPGLSSPAAWQYPPYRRLLTTTTISGSGGVVLPKLSLAGSGAESPPPVAQRPLMPPGHLSPAAWQQPAYPRLGQTITIAGAGGVVLPKPSLAGSGAVSPPLARPPLMPPGYLSPAAWQAPLYPRLGQVVTISGSGGVVLPKPSLSGSGLVTVSGIARPPLLPPGLSSPAAWQFPRYRRLPLIVTIQGTGGVMLPKPSLAGSSAAAAATTPTGSWWGLDTVLKQSREEFQAYVSRPPMACPNDGEPLRNAPATKSGSGVELYCPFCFWQYPRDWSPPSRPWD